MRLLAFSDLHRKTDAAEQIVAMSKDADLLIGAGDFAIFGQGAVDTIDILRRANLPTIIVPGNHDNSGQLRTLCLDWAEGYFLDGEMVKINGVRFFGLGRETPQSHQEPWNEARTEAVAADMLAAAPPHDVLVTHSPPFGFADLQRDGSFGGSKAVRDAIRAQQPKLHLCGHVHFSWGASEMIGATPVHNLGPGINWYDI